ncbi:MAG TPA: hypothetical protein VGD65_06935 [Chryseosolibacter sp.]
MSNSTFEFPASTRFNVSAKKIAAKRVKAMALAALTFRASDGIDCRETPALSNKDSKWIQRWGPIAQFKQFMHEFSNFPRLIDSTLGEGDQNFSQQFAFQKIKATTKLYLFLNSQRFSFSDLPGIVSCKLRCGFRRAGISQNSSPD